MATKDSLFLFEFFVEEVKSYVKCKQVCMNIQFSELFSVDLKVPNKKKNGALKKKECDVTPFRKQKVRKTKDARSKASELENGVACGQTVLLGTTGAALVHHMQHCPMILHVYSKKHPNHKVGSSEIDWDQEYIDFLFELDSDKYSAMPTILQSKTCNVFDENSPRRVMCVKLNIKLSQIQNVANPLYGTPLNETGEEGKQDDEPGTIKTIYSGRSLEKSSCRVRYRPLQRGRSKADRKEISTDHIKLEETVTASNMQEIKSENRMSLDDIRQSILSLTKSHMELAPQKGLSLMSSKSCSAMDAKQRLEMLKYIFGGGKGPFGNKVYYVGYFTVGSPNAAGSPKSTSSPTGITVTNVTPKSAGSTSQSPDRQSAISSNHTDDESKSKSKKDATFKFTKCSDECARELAKTGACVQSVCSLDFTQEAAPLVTVKKCQMIECNDKRFLMPLPPPDDRLYIDLGNMHECCKLTEKVEQVVGNIRAKMEMGPVRGPCECTCECTFGFTKRTTYCEICGGYEQAGSDINKLGPGLIPIPCPIFHNLVDKGRLKSGASASDSKGKGFDPPRMQQQQARQSIVVQGRQSMIEKRERRVSSRGPSGDRRSEAPSESDRESKKARRRERHKILSDSRFKFNYGYQAPHIGHSQCAMPCTGTLDNVPKHMGWLWNAENVPGLKYRSSWKPGACHKHVVKKLRIARYPEQEILKRKRREAGSKKKRPLKRPLLVVEKHGGEYTVTMETMKVFNKPRMVNQYPYEDKPLVTYTIGRTEEENRLRKKKKERAQRRLEREQRDFIQSAFRDMCKDICLKTYRQALGLLPNAEDPECPCYPAEPGPDRTNLDHSCSCSDSLSSFGSDTDDDEWIVEFTPPNAYFNQAYQGKKIITADAETQYTYLDYRVKLLDRYGNPVPRFFTGPDGKQECSDLGGFWSRDHKWLEINVDGYVAPDGRWAPNTFIGPVGESVDAETGKFQTTTGAWLMVGVDGYIDSNNRWRFYPKPRQPPATMMKKSGNKKGAAGDKKAGGATGEKEAVKASESTWSCFGDASPQHLSHMGIVGHGHDRKLLLNTLQKLAAQGVDVKMPHPHSLPFSVHKTQKKRNFDAYYSERTKCRHHAPPPGKGLVAMDDSGRKVYFKLRSHKNKRPQERLVTLGDQGISLSSFHVPCLSSFIGSEMMKQQQIAHIKEHNARKKRGWKPGCISKRLLRQLNQAKLNTSTVEAMRPQKRSKKANAENKPTLIVCKRNGEYIVEMQVNKEDQEGNLEEYKPLKYTIASTNHEERIKKRQRIRRRAIRHAVQEIWSEPFHPEVCEQTCLRAYKQAMDPTYDPNNPECTCCENLGDCELSDYGDSCSCLDEEISSDCSYLDLDWEIHFTPPIHAYQS